MGGANKNGQLGTGKDTMGKLSTEFDCVDSLMEYNVKSIFAGASQSFAIVDNTSDALDILLLEFEKMNREWASFGTIPDQSMKNITTINCPCIIDHNEVE
jgi:hypothetical protein